MAAVQQAVGMHSSRYKHVKSRFKEKRTLPPACESWINSREEEPDAVPVQGGARVSGELPENVTEMRLHRSRLFDLAKARQKMIQESDYTRNQFIDHQMRKSKTLDRLLINFDIEQYRNKSTSVVEKLHQKSVHAKLMILATRRLGLTIEETSKFTEEELRQKLNLSQEEAEVEKEAEPVAMQRPVTTKTQLLSPLAPTFEQARPSTVGLQQRRTGSSSMLQLPRVGSYRRQSSRVSSQFDAGKSTPTPTSVDRRPRTGSARRRVQSDRRCTGLIDALTPRYKLTTKADVDAIIRSNPSLSLPSASKAEQKQKKAPKTRRQALEMLDSIARSRYYEADNLATLS